MRKSVLAWAGLAAVSALGGCSPGDPMDDPFAHYAKRIATVDATAGNDQAANLALQTIDPWPRYVHDTHIRSDAARLSDAYENYQSIPGTLPIGGKSSASTSSSGQAITNPGGGGGTP
jgi:hypothetical protein